MDISALRRLGLINPGASEARLEALNAGFGKRLPEEYVSFLQAANGVYLDNGLVLYGADDLVERNETMEVALYAGDYLAVGDDSGGRAVLIPFARAGVYIVDQGSMDPADMREVGHSLRHWIATGCPL